jgi:hypothetical protein
MTNSKKNSASNGAATESPDNQDWRNLPARGQRDLLTVMTVQRLVALFPTSEDVRRYNAQILFAADFLHSVADYLCALSPGAYNSEEVVEAAIASVAAGYDKLIAEEPADHQCKLDFKPWRAGILIN